MIRVANVRWECWWEWCQECRDELCGVICFTVDVRDDRTSGWSGGV